MKTIEVTLSIGYPNAARRGLIEVEDDATEDEIQQTALDWANNYLDISWKEQDQRP